MKRILLGLWLFAWVALFVTFTVFLNVERDTDVVVFLGIMVLTFPSGLLVAWLLRTLSHSVLTIPDSALGPYVVFAILIVVGYLQWFVVVPWLFHRFAEPNKPLNARPRVKHAAH